MAKERPNAVAILIAAYAAVVFAVLGLTPLWLDELAQIAVGRESLAAMVRWAEMNPGGSLLPYLAQRAAIELFGRSPFVARIPAAICSIAGAVVFASLCRRLGLRSPFWATALFLAMPLQFRYALEARGYSMGLLCSLVSLLLFLRTRERGNVTTFACYAVWVALGLYSQPLTVVPVLACLFWLIGEREVSARIKRSILAAASIGVLAFLPWYLLQRRFQEASALLYFFSWKQVSAIGLLHGLSGGGLLCSVPILIAVAAGVVRIRNGRLLGCVAGAALAGPILIDALVNYFFAVRQLLFAAPALALCAASGFEWLLEGKRRWAGYALAVSFCCAAAVSDWRQATVPKDGFGAQAGVLAHLPADTCVAIAPAAHEFYYTYLRPNLEGKICAETPREATVWAVTSPYSTIGDRVQLSQMLGGYQEAAVLQSGGGTIVAYRRQ